jgi:AraC-like DNA-binding protein
LDDNGAIVTIPTELALTLYGIIIASSLLLGGGLLTTRLFGRRPSPFILIFFALFAIQAAGNLAYMLGMNWWALELRSVTGLAYGPLAYFYVREFALPGHGLRGVDWLHGLPLLGGIVSLAIWPQWEVVIYAWASALALIGYVIVNLIWLIRIGFFRQPDPERRIWLAVITALLVLLLSINALATNFNCRPILFEDVRLYQALLLAATIILMYGVLVGGLWRPFVLFPSETGSAVPSRRASSVPDHQEIETLYARFETWMAQGEGCLHPDLTVPSIAAALDVSPRKLSLAVRTCSGLTPTDWINRGRIEAVKTMLLDPEHDIQSFLDIALACGFNSKASFNRAFQKHTGMTPSAFRAGR